MQKLETVLPGIALCGGIGWAAKKRAYAAILAANDLGIKVYYPDKKKTKSLS